MIIVKRPEAIGVDDSGDDPAEVGDRGPFDAFAWLTYRLFGNSFLVVAGGAVGGLTLFMITIVVAWTLNAGGLAVVAGFIAIPVGYILSARLVRGLTRRGSPPGPGSGPR